jgi:hypothetical protein
MEINEMKQSSNIFVSHVIIILFLCSNGFANISDNFDEDFINEDIWNVYAISNVIFPMQNNNRLEIRADGSINGGMLVYLREDVALNNDFHVKVDFNSQECNYDALISLLIDNPCAGLVNETIDIGNGNEAQYAESRGWWARKIISGQSVDADVDETAIASGSFFIIHEGSIFHVGYNDTVMKSFSITDWTPCDRVSIALYGWSNRQTLTGSGSYFDNFELQFIGSVITDTENANTLFNWLESLLPDLLPSGPQTVEADGLIHRYYSTGVFLATYFGDLYFIDGEMNIIPLGAVDDLLPFARGS